jgi:glycosyltransferase involved in cell wall biosynthesis
MKEKKKLPITGFCSCKNGEQYLRQALLSVDFCEQKIFLNDNSTDNSVKIAEELGWEVYQWTGPDDMSERRNYGIAWKGDDEITPWWMEERLAPIKIDHKWMLQVDHDEIFSPNLLQHIHGRRKSRGEND